MLQEYLHAEVGKCGSEAYRSKISLLNGIKVKIRSRSVKKLKLFKQLIRSLVTYRFPKELVIGYGDPGGDTFLGSLFGVGITDNAFFVSVIYPLESLT